MLPGGECPTPASATPRRVQAIAVPCTHRRKPSSSPQISVSSPPFLVLPSKCAWAHGTPSLPPPVREGRQPQSRGLGRQYAPSTFSGHTRLCKQNTGHPIILKTTRSCLLTRPPLFVLGIAIDWFELPPFSPNVIRDLCTGKAHLGDGLQVPGTVLHNTACYVVGTTGSCSKGEKRGLGEGVYSNALRPGSCVQKPEPFLMH